MEWITFAQQQSVRPAVIPRLLRSSCPHSAPQKYQRPQSDIAICCLNFGNIPPPQRQQISQPPVVEKKSCAFAFTEYCARHIFGAQAGERDPIAAIGQDGFGDQQARASDRRLDWSELGLFTGFETAGPPQRPSISAMFCTAAPAAPLPRLSRRATSTACRSRSLANTRSCRRSVSLRARASRRPSASAGTTST